MLDTLGRRHFVRYSESVLVLKHKLHKILKNLKMLKIFGEQNNNIII